MVGEAHLLYIVVWETGSLMKTTACVWGCQEQQADAGTVFGAALPYRVIHSRGSVAAFAPASHIVASNMC
mgnify:CR=1 FL=1